MTFVCSETSESPLLETAVASTVAGTAMYTFLVTGCLDSTGVTTESVMAPLV